MYLISYLLICLSNLLIFLQKFLLSNLLFSPHLLKIFPLRSSPFSRWCHNHLQVPKPMVTFPFSCYSSSQQNGTLLPAPFSLILVVFWLQRQVLLFFYIWFLFHLLSWSCLVWPPNDTVPQAHPGFTFYLFSHPFSFLPLLFSCLWGMCNLHFFFLSHWYRDTENSLRGRMSGLDLHFKRIFNNLLNGLLSVYLRLDKVRIAEWS